MSKEVALMIGGILAVGLQDEIKSIVKNCYGTIRDGVCYTVVINLKEMITRKTCLALTSTMNATLSPACVTTDDTREQSIADGIYTYYHNNYTIYIEKTDNTITLRVYYVDFWRLWRLVVGFPTRSEYMGWYNEGKKALHSFIDEAYKTHISNLRDDKPIFFYVTDASSAWGEPIVRKRRMASVAVTADMTAFLQDFAQFRSTAEQQDYEDKHIPYRKGYCISGAQGTGKSAIVELTAAQFDSSVFEIHLNSADLTDSGLINLIARVPDRSIIVFDEFEKQYAAMKKNKTISVSDAGILAAIDGVHRLSFGTVVVIIANDISIFPPSFKTPLLRSGRIDKQFVFTQPFV